MNNKEIITIIKEAKKIISFADKDQCRRISEKLEKIKNKVDDNGGILDPELQHTMSFAKKHYPSSPTKQQAFLKFVQRSLKHSEEDDRAQDVEIQKIKNDVAELKKLINTLATKENQDFLEE